MTAFKLPIQKKANNTNLPNNLKSGIENLSGFSMDDVKVHYNSDKPAQLQALAYTQGSEIHIGSGQEKHLPHEAWHVVQQKQGKVHPTIQAKGVGVNDDPELELEADAMGDKANDATAQLSAFRPITAPISLQGIPTIQRKPLPIATGGSNYKDKRLPGLDLTLESTDDDGQLFKIVPTELTFRVKGDEYYTGATPPALSSPSQILIMVATDKKVSFTEALKHALDGDEEADSVSVDRVKMDFAGTTGVEYDADKHAELKAQQMLPFSKLPGGVTDKTNFTWHHIVPQSHLKEKKYANNKLLFRLGPSSATRIDDPGNDYLDANYNKDGTLTPFSEEVEGIFKTVSPLNHEVLATKLDALLAKEEHAGKQDFSDPKQWFIRLDALEEDSVGLDDEEKEKLRGMALPTKYQIGAEKISAEAISWGDMLEAELGGTLFAKIDKLIKTKAKLFFRGIAETSEAGKQNYYLNNTLLDLAKLDIETKINANAELQNQIRTNGAPLVFYKSMQSKLAELNKAVEETAKSQGANNSKFTGLEHEYYEGSGRKVSDNYADTEDIYTAWGKAAGAKKVLHHKLTRSRTIADGDIAGKLNKTFTPSTDTAAIIVSAEEITEYKNKFTSSLVPGDREKPQKKFYISAEEKTTLNKSRDANLIKIIKKRKTPADVTDELVIPLIKRDKLKLQNTQSASAFKDKTISDFRDKQDQHIDRVNSLSESLPAFFKTEGPALALVTAANTPNLNFLKSYVTNIDTKIQPINAELRRQQLKLPAESTAVDEAIAAFTVNCDTIITTGIGKIITELVTQMTAAKAGIKVAVESGDLTAPAILALVR